LATRARIVDLAEHGARPTLAQLGDGIALHLLAQPGSPVRWGDDHVCDEPAAARRIQLVRDAAGDRVTVETHPDCQLVRSLAAQRTLPCFEWLALARERVEVDR